jgi:hypothetical protein
MIGWRGATVGSIPEQLTPRYNGTAKVAYTFGSAPNFYRLEVTSGGMDDGNIAIFNLTSSGNPIISLIRNVGWKAGDRVVLASTDFR